MDNSDRNVIFNVINVALGLVFIISLYYTFSYWMLFNLVATIIIMMMGNLIFVKQAKCEKESEPTVVVETKDDALQYQVARIHKIGTFPSYYDCSPTERQELRALAHEFSLKDMLESYDRQDAMIANNHGIHQ